MPKGEPTSEKLVQDYTSKFYRERYSGSGFLYHAHYATKLLDGVRMSDRQSDKILDVGCGNGFMSQLYPNFDIMGIDISDGMLKNNPHKWIKASAEKIPFDDKQFDYVVARSLLHHLDRPRSALQEMFRVLKPGGKFVCFDPNHNIIYEAVRHTFQRTERFSYLHHSFGADELFNMIEDTGFRITEKKYIGYLAYPLIGFPDIINFKIPIWLGKMLIWLDELIAKSPLKKLSWALMVKAVRNE